MRTARVLSVGVGAVLAVLLTAGGASAHECFVVNRGGTPNGNAWFSIDVDAEVAAGVQAGEFTAEQGACLTDALPSTISIKVKGANGSGGTLIENNPNVEAKGADGKGIDHIGAYFAACGIGGPE